MLMKIEPGGYLQWEDLDSGSFLTGLPDEPKWLSYPAAVQTMHELINGQAALGLSKHAPAAVENAAKRAGLVDVQVEYFNTRAYPDLDETTRQWVLGAALPLLKSVKMRQSAAAASGKGEVDEEAVDKEVQVLLDHVRYAYAQGLTLHGAMGVVLARMPGN